MSFLKPLRDLAIGLAIAVCILAALAAGFLFHRSWQPYLTLYTYGPAENIFVNGKPITHLKRHTPSSPFAASFRDHKWGSTYEITIRKGNKVLHKTLLSYGSYLINASTDSWVSADAIKYGSLGEVANPYRASLSPVPVVDQSPLGVYYLNEDAAYYQAVDFPQGPPRTIPVKGERIEILKLRAGKL